MEIEKHPVDIYVDGRMRSRRKLLGLSQEDLAGALGVSFQQVQKYEKGTNRIGSSRLYEVPRFLSVSVGYFFEDFTAVASNDDNKPADNEILEDTYTSKETVNLLRAYYKINDPSLRNKVMGIIKSLKTVA